MTTSRLIDSFGYRVYRRDVLGCRLLEKFSDHDRKGAEKYFKEAAKKMRPGETLQLAHVMTPVEKTYVAIIKEVVK